MTGQPPQPERHFDEENERVRRERIRRDARRPLAVNLAEGLALSAQLSQWTGVAVDGRRAEARRPS